MTKLVVTNFEPLTCGCRVTFNKSVNPANVRRYDGGAGHTLLPSTVILSGVAWGGVVTYGSCIWNSAYTQLTYIYSFGMLPDDDYTLTLTSGVDAFCDLDGVPLDGSGDDGSDDYVHEFSTSYAVTNVAICLYSLGPVGICRGPGQTIDLLLNGSTTEVPIYCGGIPIMLGDGNGTTAVTFTLTYNATLILLTGATVDSGLPVGSTFARTSHRVTDGIATDVFAFAIGSGDLGTGAAVLLGTIQANLPIDHAGTIYRQTHVLRFSDITADGTLTIVGVDGLHVNCYIGNVTGTGGYGILDASLIGRVAGLTDTGFAAFPLIDPLLLADILSEGSVSIGGSALVNQKALGRGTPSIPDIPLAYLPPAQDVTNSFEYGTAADWRRGTKSLTPTFGGMVCRRV